jgi:hypothetical protein
VDASRVAKVTKVIQEPDFGVSLFCGFGLRFLHLLLNLKLRLYDEHLVAVRVLEIEPLQRLQNIRGVAFRPQASHRLSRSGVYVSPVVLWLSPSN